MAGQGEWALPNILFYVSDHATFEGPEPEKQLDKQLEKLHVAQRHKRELSKPFSKAFEPGVRHRSEDDKKLIREHVVKARL